MTLLAHTRVAAPQGAPERWCFFLHGILGTRANWRSFARKLVARDPRWGVVLVDLRNHGDSQGFAAPHTLDAVAGDLAALARAFDGGARAVLGHSYGGKAALAWVARERGALDRAVVVDSNPGPRPDARGSEGTLAVVAALARVGATFATRDAFVAALGAEGVGRDTALWLAMNLAREGDGLRFRLDLAAIQAMLADYFARDLWAVVERPPGGVRVHLVAGARSDVLTEGDRARAGATVIEGAGHDVHVDAPDALLDLVAGWLGAAAG